MRVYEKAAVDDMYTKGALLMRQPVLREPFGISKKQEASGSSSSKPGKSADASRDKGPSPKKPATAKVDARSPGKSNDQLDKTQDHDSGSEEAGNQASASSSSSSSASSESESENEDAAQDAAAADQGLAPESGTVMLSAEAKFRGVLDQQFAQSPASIDLLAQKLGKLWKMCSDDESYAKMAHQVPGVTRERMKEIVQEYEIKYGITPAFQEKWYGAVAKGAGRGSARPAPKPPPGAPPPHLARPPGTPPPHLRQQQHVDSVPAPQTPPDEDVPAHVRYNPPNHRVEVPPMSCLKAKRNRSNGAPTQKITYKDGLSRGDAMGPGLLTKFVVISHRVSTQLWYQQPGAQVVCDRCERLWPQSMGMLTGAHGMSQFAQNQFWCNECATMQ